MAISDKYDFLFQFNGNVTDDSDNAVALSTDSGSPSYVTSEDGQGLTVSSAALSGTIKNRLADGASYSILHKIRVNTGYTNGIIWAINSGTKPVFQFGVYNGLFYWYSYRGNGSTTASARTCTLDDWMMSGAGWGSSIYVETETSGATALANNNATGYWNFGTADDWDDREELTLLIGQGANTSGNGGVFDDGVVATGVEIDWILGSFMNEGRSFTDPVGSDYGPRTEAVLPTTFVVPEDASPVSVAFNASLTDNVSVKGPTGGGPVAPVIKEFWS